MFLGGNYLKPPTPNLTLTLTQTPTLTGGNYLDTEFKTPRGYFGKIQAMYSFVLRFTDVGEGVKDADYRGPVEVIFF